MPALTGIALPAALRAEKLKQDFFCLMNKICSSWQLSHTIFYFYSLGPNFLLRPPACERFLM